MVSRAAFIAVSMLTTAFWSGPGQSQSVTLSDEEIVSRTMEVVDWAMARNGAVGLSVAVGRGGTVLVEEGAGMADLEFDIPVDNETTFRIGSVTKQFTGAAIMKLVERGELSLDDDISLYVPDFDVGGREITVRQLLNHTSGVPSYTSQPDFFPRGSALDLTHEELLAYVDDVPFDFEPGDGWTYSNTGYYLLGMIIEAVSEQSYAEFLEQEFFEPLGLSRTYYGSEREIIRNRAQGYDYDPAAGQHFNDALISMNTPGAAGALVASAGDLVRWQAALAGGQAVQPESYEAMISSTAPTGQGPMLYGFGLMINPTEGAERIMHGGGIPGFNSVLTTLPAEDLTIALISNSNALSSDNVANNLIAALTLAEPPPLPEQRSVAQDGSEAAVRRMLGELARGEPNYELMSPQLAEATRTQLPAIEEMLGNLGEVQSIAFQAVGGGGQDIYEVQFENGTLMMQIVLDAQGRTVGAGMRPAQ